MNSDNKLGKRLKNIRLKMGLSQEEFAYRCNMQASHIGQIERGQKSPTLDTLEKLAEGLDITVSELTNYGGEIKTEENVIVNKIISYVKMLDEKQKRQTLSIIKTFFED